MATFLIMLRSVLLFVALAIPGYILVRTGIMKAESSGVLSNILLYVGMPFLIFTGTVNNLSLSGKSLLTLGITLVLGTAFLLGTLFLSAPLTAGEKERKTRAMVRFASVFPNNGFLGIPLAIAVFGQGSEALTVLILLNIITNVMQYTVGLSMLSGDKKSMNLKKAFINPVVIACAAGVLFNVLNWKETLPDVVTFSTHFSNLVTPLSMTVLGMKMGAIRFSALFSNRRTYYVSSLKLLVFPAAAVLILLGARLCLPALFSSDMILGFFIAFAMPTAGLASTFADHVGGDSQNAVSYTLGSTLISIATIPVLYWLTCLALGI